ncbi:MAG: hypothetical protein ABR543_14365 [Gemmatimonadaceae bacterium]
MSKMDAAFNLENYAPVADRIQLFYEKFPTGRITSNLVARDGKEIVFRAAVYRAEEDPRPAATGWASERIGDGDINIVACLENTETSAIGRALANLGFTGSKNRASREEMEKVARARVIQMKRVAEPEPAWGNPSSRSGARGPLDSPLQDRANMVMDAIRLLNVAVRAGLSTRRSEQIATKLRSLSTHPRQVEALESRLRSWIAWRHASADTRLADSAPSSS